MDAAAAVEADERAHLDILVEAIRPARAQEEIVPVAQVVIKPCRKLVIEFGKRKYAAIVIEQRQSGGEIIGDQIFLHERSERLKLR